MNYFECMDCENKYSTKEPIKKCSCGSTDVINISENKYKKILRELLLWNGPKQLGG